MRGRFNPCDRCWDCPPHRSDSSHQGGPHTTPGTPWRSIFAVVPILFLLTLAIPGFPSKAKAQDWRRTTSTYQGMPPRKAILFVSASRSDPGRIAASLQAAAAYRSKLEDLGFDTIVLGPASRPSLDQAVREIPGEIQPGSEVAVFVVGTTVSANDDLYIIPSDASLDQPSDWANVETEAFRLSFVLRRLKSAFPREIVVVVEDCLTKASTCLPSAFGEPNRLSSIVARGPSETATRGAASIDALHRSTLQAMSIEGDTFQQFHERVGVDLIGKGFRFESSSPLSQTFAFFPKGHFQRVAEDCFRIDLEANEVGARDPRITSWTQACEAYAAKWAFVDALQAHANAGREQVAFQQAVASCGNKAPAEDYLAGYTNGKYAAAVKRFLDQCQPPTPTVTSDAPSPSATDQRPPQIAPSFDCRRASLAAEQLICSDSELATADLRMSALYNRKLRGGFAVGVEQRAWLQLRNGACGLPKHWVGDISSYAGAKSCLLAMMRSRNNELE